MKKAPLSIRSLQKVNTRRSKLAFPQCTEWSLADWSNALAGEAGEACNVVKKIRRGDKPIETYREDLGKEIADVVMYCCLLASHADIDLESAVIQKFNEVSDRKGSRIRL